MSFRIKFIGAVGTVTGSCHLVHHIKSDSYYLIDCGLYQGERGMRGLNLSRGESDFAGIPASRIKAVFLTHAHMDHCGLIPRLYRLGFSGPVICTRLTANCALESLRDTVRNVDSFDADLYGMADVDAIRFKCPDDDPSYTLGRIQNVPGDTDLSYSLNRTGHLAGCVAVSLASFHGDRKSCTITFGADLGPQFESGDLSASLIKPYQYPSHFTQFLVLESTYGGKPNRDPLSYDRRMAVLSDVLGRALSPARGKNPVVVMPAFTLGRTQDLVVDLAYLITRTDFVSRIGGRAPTVVVDSKLARYYSNQFAAEFRNPRVNDQTGERKMRLLNDGHRIFADGAMIDRDALIRQLFEGEGSREVTMRNAVGAPFKLHYDRMTIGEGPVVYISSSGMCTSGPVMSRLRDNLRRPDAAVVFTGYIQEGADARVLKDRAAQGVSPTEVALQFDSPPRLDGPRMEDFDMLPSDVRAALVDLSSVYSGHADEARLVDYALSINDSGALARNYNPVTVFLVHGDNRSRGKLRLALEQAAKRGSEGRPRRELKKVVIPSPSSGWYNIEANDWEPVKDRNPSWDECRRLLSEAEEIQSRLSSLLQDAVSSQAGHAVDKALDDAEIWRRRFQEILRERLGDNDGMAGATASYLSDGMELDLALRPDLADAATALGIAGKINRSLVMSAFRARIKLVHPDRHPDADSAKRAEYLASAQALNAAYERIIGALEAPSDSGQTPT